MSGESSAHVWANSPYTGTAKLIHLAIAEIVNEAHQWRYWAGDAFLANMVGCDRATVVRWKARAIADGHLIDHGFDPQTGNKQYVFVMDHPMLQDVTSPGESVGPDVTSTRSDVTSRRVDVTSTRSAPITNQREPKDTNNVDPVIDALCHQLSDAVGEYQGGPSKRPKVTDRWRTDMRLLIERGPAERESPDPVPPERVQSAIAFVFTHLADPGKDGFCWATNIRSPHKLRMKWDSLLDAGRRQVQSIRKRDPLGVAAGIVTVASIMGEDPLANASRQVAAGHLFTIDASAEVSR